MKNLTSRKVLFTLLTTIFAHSTSWAQDYSKYPTISIQGNDYPNACHPLERKKVQEVLRDTNIPKKEELWTILDMLLCAARTEKNLDKMLAATSKRIRMEAEGTGEKEPNIKTVPKNLKLVEDFFAQGKAWGIGLIIINNTVRINYSENEACVEERIIEFSNEKWEIVEIGQACD
ncbi:MAG: hypothetical protein AB1437_08210 [Pseudomonadota bacterium]